MALLPCETHQGGNQWVGTNLDCSISFSFLYLSLSAFVFRALPMQKCKLKAAQCAVYSLCAKSCPFEQLFFLYNQWNCPSRGHLACSPPPLCECSLAQTARCYERIYWNRPLGHKGIEKKSHHDWKSFLIPSVTTLCHLILHGALTSNSLQSKTQSGNRTWSYLLFFSWSIFGVSVLFATVWLWYF